jgi:hypothetical protein
MPITLIDYLSCMFIDVYIVKGAKPPEGWLSDDSE